jgi:hypothetical protein
MQMQPQTQAEWTKQVAKDIAFLKRGSRQSTNSPGGTPAERDEFYGVPTNDEERVQLAGSRWFDTTLGLWFTYFANASAPGALPGLRRASSGWGIQDLTMPYALIDLQATTALPTGNTLLIWRSTAPSTDPFGMFNLANPTRFMTAPWTGVYQVNYKLRFSVTTAITTNVKRNGANYTRARSADSGAAGAAPTVQANVPIFVTAGQYLELEVTPQLAGSAVAGETFVEITYTGPER